jgi:hypothetical protein
MITNVGISTYGKSILTSRTGLSNSGKGRRKRRVFLVEYKNQTSRRTLNGLYHVHASSARKKQSGRESSHLAVRSIASTTISSTKARQTLLIGLAFLFGNPG